jgi:hypothetical protein
VPRLGPATRRCACEAKDGPEWLAERHIQETPAQKLARQAAQGAERQERPELAAEVERAAELADERDARALRFQQAGLVGRSLGDVFAEASRAGRRGQRVCRGTEDDRQIDRLAGASG